LYSTGWGPLSTNCTDTYQRSYETVLRAFGGLRLPEGTVLAERVRPIAKVLGSFMRPKYLLSA